MDSEFTSIHFLNYDVTTTTNDLIAQISEGNNAKIELILGNNMRCFLNGEGLIFGVFQFLSKIGKYEDLTRDEIIFRHCYSSAGNQQPNLAPKAVFLAKLLTITDNNEAIAYDVVIRLNRIVENEDLESYEGTNGQEKSLKSFKISWVDTSCSKSYNVKYGFSGSNCEQICQEFESRLKLLVTIYCDENRFVFKLKDLKDMDIILNWLWF